MKSYEELLQESIAQHKAEMAAEEAAEQEAEAERARLAAMPQRIADLECEIEILQGLADNLHVMVQKIKAMGYEWDGESKRWISFENNDSHKT